MVQNDEDHDSAYEAGKRDHQLKTMAGDLEYLKTDMSKIKMLVGGIYLAILLLKLLPELAYLGSLFK